MERIILELDDNAARKWASFSAAKRKQLSDIISKLFNLDTDTTAHGKTKNELQQFIEQNKAEWPEYDTFLNKIGAKAAANGLTEDVLDQLLKEDE